MNSRTFFACVIGVLTLTAGPLATLRADESPTQKEHAAAEVDHVK